MSGCNSGKKLKGLTTSSVHVVLNRPKTNFLQLLGVPVTVH